MLQPPAPWTGSAAAASMPETDPASDMDARPATPPRGRMAEAAERSGGEASPSGAFARVYGEASFRRATRMQAVLELKVPAGLSRTWPTAEAGQPGCSVTSNMTICSQQIFHYLQKADFHFPMLGVQHACEPQCRASSHFRQGQQPISFSKHVQMLVHCSCMLHTLLDGTGGPVEGAVPFYV